jgi:hypothetical protein
LLLLSFLLKKIETLIICIFFIDMEAGKDLTPAEVEQLLDSDDPMEAGGGGGDGGGGNPTKAPSLLSTGCNTDPASNTVSIGTCTDPSTASRNWHQSLSSSASITSTGTGSLPRAYANVRAARSDINTVRPLCGSEVYIKNELGSFVNEGDERYALANHRHCYNSKKIFRPHLR